VQRVLSTGVVKVDPPEAKEVPTVEEFTKVYLDVSRVDNKPSSVDTKDQILRKHIVPFFGALRLDRVTYAGIQDFKVQKIADGIAKKTVNNFLTVLRRMLVIARSESLSMWFRKWSGCARRNRSPTLSTSMMRDD